MGLIVLFLLIYAVILTTDLVRNREKIAAEPGSVRLLGIMAPLIMFFSTMGISDFVMNTLFFEKCSLVDGKRLPGTLISSGTLPLGAVAVGYLLSARTDVKIIVTCMVCQAVGAVLGVHLMAGLDGSRIKKAVGVAMLVSALFLILRLFGVGGSGGTLTTLPPWKIVVCGVCACFLGIGNMIGLGSKAPYLSLLLLLGLSADCVLPVIMPTCTVSGLFGGVQYVRRGLYQRKITLIYSTVGFIGIAAGFIFVMNLPEIILQVVMLFITVYTGVSMLQKKK